MRQTAFIFHGSNGSPKYHWYPWLKQKLEEKGIEVIAPHFPWDKNQLLNNWFEVLKKYNEKLDDSILIGHSLGACFILNILNELDVKVKASFLVAGFVDHLNLKDYGIDDFSNREFDFSLIKNRCERIEIFHGDNDYVVPVSKGHELAKKLDCELHIISKGGHILLDDGFYEFDFLFERILNLL